MIEQAEDFSVGAGLRSRIAHSLPTLAPAQRRLAAFLLEHLASASDYTITDLAEAAGVSIGTISHLCRQFGLRGYQDLRLALARESVFAMSSRDGDLLGLDSDRVESRSPAGEAIRQVFSSAAEAVVQTARGISPASLETAAAALAAAGRIECVGVGTAGFVAAEAALKFRKLGFAAEAYQDTHQQAMTAALLGGGDVLLAISHSGRTVDTIRCASLARDASATVVAISGPGRSPLSDLADVSLETVSYDTGFQMEPMASTIVELAIVQTLFMMVLKRGGPAAEERLARTQQALEDRHVKGRAW